MSITPFLKHIMRPTPWIVTLTAVLSVALTAAYFYIFGNTAHRQEQTNSAAATTQQVSSGEGDTVYISPMHPWIVTNEPGQCPI